MLLIVGIHLKLKSQADLLCRLPVDRNTPGSITAATKSGLAPGRAYALIIRLLYLAQPCHQNDTAGEVKLANCCVTGSGNFLWLFTQPSKGAYRFFY